MVASAYRQCDHLKDDLSKCLFESDCVQKRGLNGQECLQNHFDELSPECQQVYRGFVDCKRSLWDMRSR